MGNETKFVSRVLCVESEHGTSLSSLTRAKRSYTFSYRVDNVVTIFTTRRVEDGAFSEQTAR
jgi:hypothetical protein